MLVLSRKENQKVLFPNLGITVEVLGVKGANVRLGIDAPPRIRILRAELDELQDGSAGQFGETPQTHTGKHQRNNLLNTIWLQINVAEKFLQRGETKQAREQLQNALQRLSDLDEQESTKLPQLRTGTEPAPPRWRALLVEDNANERDLLASILRMCGFQVDTVADGIAAIDYLQQNEQPDCVLMDMQMPRLSGPETISMIREQLEFTDVPIYGVSGLQRQEAKVPLGERGVAGWFNKPVDADQMLRQIFADFDEVEAKSLN